MSNNAYQSSYAPPDAQNHQRITCNMIKHHEFSFGSIQSQLCNTAKCSSNSSTLFNTIQYSNTV